MANRERRRIQIFRAGAASNSTDCTAYDRYVELRTFVPLSGRPKLNRSRARRRLYRTRLQSFDIALDFSRWRVNLARTLCLKKSPERESMHRASAAQGDAADIFRTRELWLETVSLLAWSWRPSRAAPWRLLAHGAEPKLTSMPLPLDNRPGIILEYPASSKDSSTDWTSSG